MMEWWQFVLILIAVIVVLGLGAFVVSIPDIRRYLRIRRM